MHIADAQIHGAILNQFVICIYMYIEHVIFIGKTDTYNCCSVVSL